MATYQSSHTGAQIDAAVDAVAGKADKSTTYTKTEVDEIVDDYLPLTGGTLSGALTVNNSITTTGNILLPNTGAVYSKGSDATDYNLLHLSANNNVNFGYGTATIGTVYIYGKAISIRVNGVNSAATAMFIDASKNVGIGTTSPTALLDVNGNASIAGTLTLGGNVVVSVLSGSTAPSSSAGSDGDIYIQTT